MRIYASVLTFLACGGLLIGTVPAEAKGPPEWIRISGSTMFGPLEVRDPELLQDLGIAQLEDVDAPVPAPDGLSRILHITRGFDSEDGDKIAFDEVLYAFDPQGGRGHVYYLGIVNGSGPYDGNWYRASEGGHRSLIAALEGAGVSLAAYPSSPPQDHPESLGANFAALLLGAAGAAGLSGWAVGRRSVSVAAAPSGEPV